jgi:hypothetical protein
MEEQAINRGIIKEEKVYLSSYMPVFANRLYSGLKAGIDKLNNYRQLKADFYNRVRYELNLESPRSYNEKIQWKKLNDRNPLLTVTADKYEVRSYLRDVLGKKKAKEILIPLYYATANPNNIPFENLPQKFVIKPNHGSQMHLFIRDSDKIDKGHIIRECRRWLNNNFGFYNYEWAYRNIKRKIIVEKLIESETGELPHDYKFYCFHGKCRMIRVTKNRFGKEILAGYFDEGWNLLNAGVPGYTSNHHFEKPSAFKEMITLSETLSRPFDFVRVDLYFVDSRIYFGELTHYEASGFGRFDPESFDYMLGRHWDVKPKYWLKLN